MNLIKKIKFRYLNVNYLTTLNQENVKVQNRYNKAPTFEKLMTNEYMRSRGRETSYYMDRFEKMAMKDFLNRFVYSSRAADKALELYINSELWPEAATRFRRFLLRTSTKELIDIILQNSLYTRDLEDFLFTYFSKFVQYEYEAEINAYKEIVKSADLRKPHEWYLISRSIKRKIIYHAGPTNSGKTFNALKSMKEAKKGIYCAPLRLLAMEIYDQLNAEGIYCNLITGQERREVPGATHTACTIEMCHINEHYDICIIDEIQLIGDRSRGYAWTRALHGVCANEIHLCGDPSAVPLIREICKKMDEAFDVIHYERFLPLEICKEPFSGYQDIQLGDCIVAFSRKDIYQIKKIIEEKNKTKACVIYGALPPETRRQQALLFNELNNGYDVLVASDAIGMGLNLNIRRIIFHTLKKFQGKSIAPVSHSQIKQIAGRSGRRNSAFPIGYVTCHISSDIERLESAMKLPQSFLKTTSAGLFPEFEQIELFARKNANDDLSDILKTMLTESRLDGLYYFCNQESFLYVANMIKHLPLSLKSRFMFSAAPANIREPRITSALLEYATMYAKGYPVCCKVFIPKKLSTTEEQIKHLEILHQVVSMWLWLSYRFDEESFPGRETADSYLKEIIDLIDKGLHNITNIV